MICSFLQWGTRYRGPNTVQGEVHKSRRYLAVRDPILTVVLTVSPPEIGPHPDGSADCISHRDRTPVYPSRLPLPWDRPPRSKMTSAFWCTPSNIRSWTNAGLMLVHRLRRWSNINPALRHCLPLLVASCKTVTSHFNGCLTTPSKRLWRSTVFWLFNISVAVLTFFSLFLAFTNAVHSTYMWTKTTPSSRVIWVSVVRFRGRQLSVRNHIFPVDR